MLHVEAPVSVDLQGIDIEESVSLQAHARQQTVEQDDFHDVEILGVLVQEEEAPVVKHLARCRAGLVVTAAMNVIRGTKPLDPAVASYPAGDAHLGVDQVLPEPIDRRGVLGVAGEGRHVDQARGKPTERSRVPARLAEFVHGQVLGRKLGVVPDASIGFRHAPHVGELASHLQILRVTRALVQPGMSELHPAVPVRFLDRVALGVEKFLARMRRELLRGLQVLVFARRPIVGHRCLRPTEKAATGLVHEVVHAGDELVHHGNQLRILAAHQAVPRALQGANQGESAPAPELDLRLSRPPLGEIGLAMMIVYKRSEPVHDVGKSHLEMRLHTVREKTSVQLHRIDRHGTQWVPVHEATVLLLTLGRRHQSAKDTQVRKESKRRFHFKWAFSSPRRRRRAWHPRKLPSYEESVKR